MENNVEVEYECYPTVDNNHNVEGFENSSGEVYFPNVPEVLQANQQFLNKMVGIDNNLVSDQLPKQTAPTNVPQPEPVPMPVIKPNSLPRPVKIALPDGVSASAPVLLLSKLPNDLKDETVMSLSPDNTPSNNLDDNLKKSNEMSVENGLPPVPVVAAPSGKPVVDQINTVVVSAPSSVPVVPTVPVVPVSAVSTKMIPDDAPKRMANRTADARIVELPVETEPAPQMLNVKKTHKRKFMKKVLMYIAIALVIYLIYLLFNEK
jgi:hypothetical protein